MGFIIAAGIVGVIVVAGIAVWLWLNVKAAGPGDNA